LQNKQGRPSYGVDMKIVDGEGRELPRDGKAFGNPHVKGAWILSEYFNEPGGGALRDGWFPIGDVVILDPGGYIQITDRSKAAIKAADCVLPLVDREGASCASAV
jgi:3-(methylthio)propionyl---CoA ligase